MHEYRCDCGKLLFKGVVITSHIEIKCSRCGKIKAVSGITEGLSAERFCTLFLDDKGRILNTGEAVKDIFGYTKDEAVKMNVDEIIFVKKSNFFAEIKSMIANGSSPDHSIECEAWHQKKDSQEEPLKIWSRIFTLGDKKYYICVCANSAELMPEIKILHDNHAMSKVWAAAAGILAEVLAVIGNHTDF